MKRPSSFRWRTLSPAWQSSRHGVGLAGTVLLISCAVLAPATQAATIVFTASNLSDTTPGEDLWQYQYSVSDISLNPGQGFSIFFDSSRFQNLLASAPSAPDDWDLLTIQPDPALGASGFLDALALRAPSLQYNSFTVRFVWLGVGLPGAQPFTVYNADFSTNTQGATLPAMPSPPALTLLPVPAENKLQVIWTPASALLEESSDLVIWTPVTAAVSPLTVSLSNPQGPHFYRLRTPP